MESVLKDKNDNNHGSSVLNLSILKSESNEKIVQYAKENHNPKSLMEIAVDLTKTLNNELLITQNKKKNLEEIRESSDNESKSFEENDVTENSNPKKQLVIASDTSAKWKLESPSTSTPLNNKILSRLVSRDVDSNNSYSESTDLESADKEIAGLSFLLDGINNMKLNTLGDPAASDEEDEFLSFNNNHVLSQQNSMMENKQTEKENRLISEINKTFKAQEQNTKEYKITALEIDQKEKSLEVLKSIESEIDQTPSNDQNNLKELEIEDASLNKTEIPENIQNDCKKELNVTEVLEKIDSEIQEKMNENEMLQKNDNPELNSLKKTQLFKNQTLDLNCSTSVDNIEKTHNQTKIIEENRMEETYNAKVSSNISVLQDKTIKIINNEIDDEKMHDSIDQEDKIKKKTYEIISEFPIKNKSNEFSFPKFSQSSNIKKEYSAVPEELFTNASSYNFGDSDFEFLQKFGKPSADDIGRDSVLLKFDPLFEKPVPLNKQTTLGRLSEAKEEDSFSDLVLKDFDVKKHSLGEQEYSHTNNSFSNIDEFTHLLSSKNDKRMSVDIMKDISPQNDNKIDSNFECEDLKLSSINNEDHNIELMEIEKIKMEAEQREEALLKRISEKDKQISKMNNVVEAYEKAIAELIAEKEQLIQSYEKKCNDLKSDSEMNAQHLASLESTFSDLHAKYERTKQIAFELKEHEESILQDRKTLQESLKMQEARYEKMKTHAMAQLEIANNKLAEMLRNHQAEVTKLKAQLKKEEISRASVHEQLIQKSKENAELVKICDELIGNHGNSQNA